MSFDLEKARDAAKYDDCEALRLFPEALNRIDELETECDTLTNSLINAQAEMGARLQVAKEQQAKDIATIDYLRALLIEERAAVIHNFDMGGGVWGWDVLNNEIQDRYRKQAACELGFKMRL